MTKNLKPQEVLSVLQKKVQLKRDIKELKSVGETKKAEILKKKVSRIICNSESPDLRNKILLF